MKILKNKKGTVIEAAIVVLLLVTILGGGIITIAYSYYKRSLDNANYRSAYLIASSTAQSIGREIASKDSDTDYKEYVPSEVGKDNRVYLSKLNLKVDKVKDQGDGVDDQVDDVDDQVDDVNKQFKTIDETSDDDKKPYIELTNETTLTIRITIEDKGQTASVTQTLLRNTKDDKVWQLGKLR